MAIDNVLISSSDRFHCGNLFLVQVSLYLELMGANSNIKILSPLGNQYTNSTSRRYMLNNGPISVDSIAISMGSYISEAHITKAKMIKRVLPVFLIDGTLYAVRGSDNENVLKLVV